VTKKKHFAADPASAGHIASAEAGVKAQQETFN